MVLAARYAINPRKVAQSVSANCLLTQADEAIVAMTTAFNCVVALLVAGEKLDVVLSDKLMDQVKAGHLPFHTVAQQPRVLALTGRIQAGSLSAVCTTLCLAMRQAPPHSSIDFFAASRFAVA